MVILKCTLRLLRRLRVQGTVESQDSTTVLGSWYANDFVVARRPYVICTSERSKLSVVVPFKESVTLPDRFRVRLRFLLENIGIPMPLIEKEMHEMNVLEFGRAQSRAVLGNMKQLTFFAKDWMQEYPEVDLKKLDLLLSDHLVGPEPYIFPQESTIQLFRGVA